MFDSGEPGETAAALGRLVALPDSRSTPVDVSRVEELGVEGAVDVIRAARRLAAFAEAVSLAATAALDRCAGRDAGRRVVLHEPTGLAAVHSAAAVELSLATTVTPREAEARVALAARVVEVLPRTWASLASGEVGPAHARCLAHGTRGLDPRTTTAVEAQVLAAAGGQTVPELAAAVARARARVEDRPVSGGARPDDPDPPSGSVSRLRPVR